MRLNKKVAALAVSLGTALLAGGSLQASAATITFDNAIAGFSLASETYYNTLEDTDSYNITSLLSVPVVVPEGIAFANVTDALNVRKGPGTEYARVGKLGKNAACIVQSVDENGWAKIVSGEVTGYAKTDWLIMGKEAVAKAPSFGKFVATVNRGVTNVNVRMQPTTQEDNIITKVSAGEDLEVIEELVINKDDPNAKTFVKVRWNSDSDGVQEAYITSEYVTLSYKYNWAVVVSSYGDGVSTTRTNMIDFAMKYIGTPYVWGGNSLTYGVDCSGFVKQVFTQFGYGSGMPRVSREMARTYPTISASQAKAGDLVFYHNIRTGVVDHVAIYIGNGKIIHANNGVEVSNVNYRTVYKYARVIKD